jgi:hypothetical protein
LLAASWTGGELEARPRSFAKAFFNPDCDSVSGGRRNSSETRLPSNNPPTGPGGFFRREVKTGYPGIV